MSNARTQEPKQASILDFVKQYVLSPVDEIAFSSYKVAEAIGLNKALQKSTWKMSMTALGNMLKGVYDFTVEGMQHVPRAGAAIILTKNSSGAYPFIACVAVAETSDRVLYQSFDHEYFKVYGLRSWFHYLESISIHNGLLDDHSKAFVKRKLEDRNLVGLTLEHLKRDNGKVSTIENASLVDIATENKVPIIPIAVPNIENVLNIKSEKYTFNQRIHVTVREPFTGHLQGKSTDECFKALQDALHVD